MIAPLTFDRISHLLLLAVPCWVIGGVIGFLGCLNGWLSFVTLWFGGAIAYLAFVSQKVDIEGKAVLITGCDSGFGNALARRLDAMGFVVFAGCLLADKGGEGAKGLKKDCSEKLHVIQLNVVSEEEVKKARSKVDGLLPDGVCLWGIVSNAGIGTFGEVEWVPISTYKRMAEVNLFGMISVIKAFLPLVRKSKGRVVNVASMLGRFAAAMRSPYCLTKFAVGGFSDCLRQEMIPWGVDVAVIEPGNYISGTAIFTEETVGKHGEEMWENMSEEAKQDYGEEMFKEKVELMKSYVTLGDSDVSIVIDAFVDALTQRYPQSRYQPANWYYKTRMVLGWHLGEWLYDLIYGIGCLRK